MLRVVVYINQTPLIDTHAVRQWPPIARAGDMCTYRTVGGGRLRQEFDLQNGAAKLAIKLLKRVMKESGKDGEGR